MWLVKKRENKGDRQKKKSRDRVGGGCKRHVAINKCIHRRLGRVYIQECRAAAETTSWIRACWVRKRRVC